MTRRILGKQHDRSKPVAEVAFFETCRPPEPGASLALLHEYVPGNKRFPYVITAVGPVRQGLLSSIRTADVHFEERRGR